MFVLLFIFGNFSVAHVSPLTCIESLPQEAAVPHDKFKNISGIKISGFLCLLSIKTSL